MFFYIILFTSVFTLGSGTDSCESLNCSQLCISNTIFPPYCGCIQGFFVPDNPNNCEPADEWGLLYINETINLLSDVESDNRKSSVQINLNFTYGGLAYDAWSDKVFWNGGIGTAWVGVYERVRLPTGNISATKIFDVNGISNSYFGECVVDWITGNLYFTVPSFGIILCSNISNLCTVVVEDVRIESLAILPNQGILVWLNMTSIMKSDLSGNSSVQLLFDKTYEASLVTVDQGSLRVFWVESMPSGWNFIKSVGFQGENPNENLYDTYGDIKSIVVFGDRFYLLKYDELLSFDKRTGHDVRTLLSSDKKYSLWGLAVLSQANQPISRENHCLFAICSHICVLSDDSIRCLCPVGMALSDDGVTCIEDYDIKRLVIALDNQLKVMRWGSIGRDVFDTITFAEIKEISALLYHQFRSELIFSDKITKKIYGFNLEQMMLRIIIDDQPIKAMGLDPVGDNLYYAVDDYLSGDTVEVMSMQTLVRKVIIKQIGKITAIAVVPEVSSIFLAGVDGDETKIYKSSLNGEGVEILINVGDRELVALAFNKISNYLVWEDYRHRKIETMSLKDHGINQVDGKCHFPSGLLVGEDLLLCVENSSVAVCRWNSYTYYCDYPISVTGFKANTSTVISLAFHSKNISHLSEFKEKHACSWENTKRKQCSHLCLPDGGLTGSCHCPEGLTLWRDGETCVDKSCKDAGPKSLCANGSCVPDNNICDDDCAYRSDEVGCRRIESNGNVYFEIIVIITLLLIVSLVGFCHLLSFVKGKKYYVLENKEIIACNVKQ